MTQHDGDQGPARTGTPAIDASTMDGLATENPTEDANPSLDLSLFFLLDHYREMRERERSNPRTLASRYRDHLELCVEAERLGYEGVFFAEHHFSDFGVVPNPAVLLSAVAARTKTLKLGPAVTVLPFRHPMQVVEDYGMVDQISGGRLVLGVGSGALASEFRGFGLDASTKRWVFEDRLEVVENAFAGEPGPDGSPSNVLGFGGRMPPIYLATTSVEGARAAGALGYRLLTLCSPETPSLQEVVHRIEAHAERFRIRHQEPGLQARPEVIVTLFAHFARTAELARRQAAPALERFLRAHGAENADGFAVYDEMVSRGTGAFGTLEDVLDRLRPLLEIGVRHFSLWMGFGDMERSELEASMALAAQLRGRARDMARVA